MTGKRTRRLTSLTMLAGAALALVLPSAMMLFAEEKSPPQVVKAPPTTASKPATASAPKSKEAKKAEEIARVMDFFSQTQPDVYEKAKRLRETDPAKFESLIQPTIRTVNALEEIRKNDPELYDLKIEDYRLTFSSQSLAQQLRRPDVLPNEREKILSQLNGLASRQFDVGQKIRQKEITAIEDRVKRLQSQLEERDKDKDKIIKRRVDELTK